MPEPLTYTPGRVWAPTPQVLELIADDCSGADPTAVALQRQPNGWWAPPQPIEPSTRYSFRVDGDVLADPASRWQPNGIDGPSAVDDPGAFAWTDAGFAPPPWNTAVIYELHLGTFSGSGDAAGAVDHLGHLVDLGVTHVEIMPLGTYGGRWGWGYDGVFWSAPHHTYGEPDDIRRLIDACHGHGLGVIIDVVYNHLGPVGNVLARFGPYFTEQHHTPWGSAINLDQEGSDGVRHRILSDATMWLRDYHADGLRLDAVHALIDDSTPHLLAELGAAADALAAQQDREIVLIAETDLHDPTPVTSRVDGGYGLGAQWADDLHHAVHVALTGESTGYYGEYQAPGLIAEALNSVHTQGRPVGDLPRERFVVSLQNHDQIGNRPAGDRLHHSVGSEMVRAAATLFLLAPTTPMIFQGEEWAASSPFPYFADHTGELADAIREGREREFAWTETDDGPELPDALAEATYRSAALDWDELGDGEHLATLDWYRELLALRRDHPELGASTPISATQDDNAVVTAQRGAFTIVANLSTATAAQAEGHIVAFTGAVAADATGIVVIGPQSAVVLSHP